MPPRWLEMALVEEGQDLTYLEEREEPESGSYFFVFLVVSIVLIIFMYIVYHNKTKIKNYFGDLQAERQARKNTRKVNYNVYIRLEETT
ncbi:hypothetical protein HOLleu_37713 [Holothuria leucospilota]|uniref:Uncharacterized protein n=1 Tax=Holothuria leucospilota TaxID=206669 RepID=A0A9Q1BDJ6_HOLLE|nr:hypothetical protein HOLleu_37713 [Holothuria leucospilota]